MQSEAINLWAERLTKEVFSEYQSKYSFWRHGFKTFYSPVRMNPVLMIISYQPGGTEENLKKEDKYIFERGDFSLPESNEYAEADYPMARNIRKLFAFEGGMGILRQSVVFPLIFFRAPKIKEWKNLQKEQRKEMEKFSLMKTGEIIKKIRPQKILILGIATYECLKSILYPVLNERVLLERGDNKERMMMRAVCGGYEVYAIIHPSGARISAEDRTKLSKLLADVLGFYNPDFLQSIDRAEVDVKKGRTRKIASLKALN